MATVEITQLPVVSTAAPTDVFPVVQNNITKQETLQQVLDLFNTNVQLASSAQVTGLNAQLATYLPLAGGTMTGALILDTINPSTDLEAASKGYVDTIAGGFKVVLACDAATTANLNATQAGAGVGATLTNAGAMAAFAVDGYSASLNDRILVKNQTLSQFNGIYTVTTVGSGSANWVLTRATDYDQSTQIVPGTLIAVNMGTVNANTSWLETATVATVDTDPILFSQFTFAPSTFLQVANDLSDVASASTSRTNLGLGTVATKTASDNTKTNAVMLNAAPSIGNLAIFTDVNGTIGDGGTPSTIALNDITDGRLTFTSGSPVTVADVVGATILYYTPYIGKNITLFDGTSIWNTLSFSELSIAIPSTTNTMYDVLIYNNSGVPTLELQSWTNDTTRTVSLVRQDGVLVLSGSLTRRYVGTFRTTTVSGQSEDSVIRRWLWNYYNRVTKPMLFIDSTPSWTYSTAAWRQARGSTANQLDAIIGVIEDFIYISVGCLVGNSTITQRTSAVGIGINSTTVNSSTYNVEGVFNSTVYATPYAYYNAYPPSSGRHIYTRLEYGDGTDTQTWEGTGSTSKSGIIGYLKC